MSRKDHTFQFPASEIAAAARREASYHAQRADYWEGELDKATRRVQETASVEVTRSEATNGWHPQVVVDYGDPAAYQRMHEASKKWQGHQEALERFDTDASLYATQDDRVYDLAVEDVHYYRMGGGPRDD